MCPPGWGGGVHFGPGDVPDEGAPGVGPHGQVGAPLAPADTANRVLGVLLAVGAQVAQLCHLQEEISTIANWQLHRRRLPSECNRCSLTSAGLHCTVGVLIVKQLL